MTAISSYIVDMKYFPKSAYQHLLFVIKEESYKSRQSS